MKIFMLIPELRMGGAQRSFIKVARMFSANHQVVLIVFNRDMTVDFKVENTIISLDVSSSSSLWGKLVGFFRRYRKLKEIVKAGEPDIILSYLEGANILNALLPKQGFRIISQRGSVLHDETMNNKYKWIRQNILIKFLYPRADLIVPLNYHIKIELESLLQKKTTMHVIENLFDIDTIQQQANEELQYEFMKVDRKFLCCVGRVAQEKGFHHVIHILRHLRNKQNDCGLVIVGEGPALDSLKKLATRYELTYDDTLSAKKADIYFTGKLSNPYAIIKNADFLIISSSSEGGPNVLPEAMICRTLVVSANCPAGPREKLSPSKIIPFNIDKPVFTDYGVLMPVFQRSPIAEVYNIWADLLIELMQDPDTVEKLVNNAFKYVQKFSEDRIYEKWQKAIEKQ